jgi:3-deoxy-D-manno-octulosonic-acid transferase
MRHLIDAIYLILSLLLWPKWLRKLWRDPGFRQSAIGRFVGRAPRVAGDQDVVWLHGASIGEVGSLKPIVEQFREARPGTQFVISAYESDGVRTVRSSFSDVIAFYLPFDLSWSVRRAYKQLNPRLLVLNELELWPNLLLEARRQGTPVAVINCRVNDADFNFFKRIRRLHCRSLKAVKWWGAQTERDAHRISQLLDDSHSEIVITGSLKYETTPDESNSEQAEHLRQLLGFRSHHRILVAGSTHAPEEEMLLNAFIELEQDFPDLRLAIVPRNQDRFPEVGQLLRNRSASFTQRSLLKVPIASASPVTLVDSIGELPVLWQLADFAFVGGSLANNCGGHNMIEPAAQAKPVCFGPNVWNFDEVANGLIEARAASRVTSTNEIVQLIATWLRDATQAQELGQRAKGFIRSRQGAVHRTVPALLALARLPVGQI